MKANTCRIDYGTTGLELDLTGLNATVLEPRYPPPLKDEARAFQEAVTSPFGGIPLKERIAASETVAIAIPDITRALPTERLLRWLFAELDHVPAENITIISGTGTHRANTPAEWVHMVGEQIYAAYTCIDHDGEDMDSMVSAGMSEFGYEVHLNRAYAEADRRILLGFI